MWNNKNEEKVEKVNVTRFVLKTPKAAIDKINEVSGGKFKCDIKPYPGILNKDNSDFLVIQENGVWYLRIC